MKTLVAIRKLLRAVIDRRLTSDERSVAAALRVAEKVRKKPLEFTEDMLSGAIREANRNR